MREDFKETDSGVYSKEFKFFPFQVSSIRFL